MIQRADEEEAGTGPSAASTRTAQAEAGWSGRLLGTALLPPPATAVATSAEQETQVRGSVAAKMGGSGGGGMMGRDGESDDRFLDGETKQKKCAL